MLPCLQLLGLVPDRGASAIEQLVLAEGYTGCGRELRHSDRTNPNHRVSVGIEHQRRKHLVSTIHLQERRLGINLRHATELYPRRPVPPLLNSQGGVGALTHRTAEQRSRCASVPAGSSAEPVSEVFLTVSPSRMPRALFRATIAPAFATTSPSTSTSADCTLVAAMVPAGVKPTCEATTVRAGDHVVPAGRVGQAVLDVLEQRPDSDHRGAGRQGHRIVDRQGAGRR